MEPWVNYPTIEPAPGDVASGYQHASMSPMHAHTHGQPVTGERGGGASRFRPPCDGMECPCIVFQIQKEKGKME